MGSRVISNCVHLCDELGEEPKYALEIRLNCLADDYGWFAGLIGKKKDHRHLGVRCGLESLFRVVNDYRAHNGTEADHFRHGSSLLKMISLDKPLSDLQKVVTVVCADD